MQNQTYTLKSSDGLDLFFQTWQGETPPKAVLAIVHGMGEHSGRYQNLINYFLPKGYALAAFDHRGHGKSQGKKGHTPSYQHLMQDVEIFLQKVSSLFPQTPVFLYGHSMGGNVVLNYAIKHTPDVQGVIASAPWLRLAFAPPKWQVILAKIVNNIFPSLTQPTNLEVEAISRNPEVVKAYKADPLVHGKTTPRFFVEGSKAGEWALANAQHFSLPLLIFHGEADRLTSASATKELAEKVRDEFIQFKLWPEAYHEIHNDLDKDKLFAWMEEWLDKKLDKS